MIGPIVKFLLGFCFPFIIVVPEINPTSYRWPWLIGFIWAKICIDCKEEWNKISGQARISSSSMSCFVIFMQSNPFVTRHIVMLYFLLLTAFPTRAGVICSISGVRSLCVSEWWGFLCFVRTGDMQERNSPLVTGVSWGLKSTVDEDTLARRMAELAKTCEIYLY